jgi:hypothetical protein
VNRLVTWDHSRNGISPGTLVQALVINILGDRKALYRVSEFYRDKDSNLTASLLKTHIGKHFVKPGRRSPRDTEGTSSRDA